MREVSFRDLLEVHGLNERTTFSHLSEQRELVHDTMTLMTRLLESTYMNDSYIEVSNFLVICVIASLRPTKSRLGYFKEQRSH